MAMNTTRTIGSVLAAFFLQGCAGTLYTRVGLERPTSWCAIRDRGDFCGSQPYQAVVTDFHFMNFDANGFVPEIDATVGLFSVPLDFTLDTCFLPADGICWACGMQKKRFKPYRFF